MNDERFCIDNNLVENAVRPLAVGRKNFLFCRKHDAAVLKWDDANGELYQMTYEHRADPSVTLDDIKQAYIQLRAFMDPIVASLSEEKE